MRPDRHYLVRLAFALVIVVASPGAASAADLPIPRRNAPRVQGDFSMQAGPPNCSRWTDDCVNCTRGTDGAPPTCSNIGFACQPKAIRCLGAQ